PGVLYVPGPRMRHNRMTNCTGRLRSGLACLYAGDRWARMWRARRWLAVPRVTGRGPRIGQRGGRARMTGIDRTADIDVSRGFAQVTVRIPLSGHVNQEWV